MNDLNRTINFFFLLSLSIDVPKSGDSAQFVIRNNLPDFSGSEKQNS